MAETIFAHIARGQSAVIVKEIHCVRFEVSTAVKAWIVFL